MKRIYMFFNSRKELDGFMERYGSGEVTDDEALRTISNMLVFQGDYIVNASIDERTTADGIEVSANAQWYLSDARESTLTYSERNT